MSYSLVDDSTKVCIHSSKQYISGGLVGIFNQNLCEGELCWMSYSWMKKYLNLTP